MASQRVINFSPGPAKLPQEVLERAQKELQNWNNTGISVMEMSHRSAEFEGIIKGVEQSVRELLKVPDNYKVLFMHGGALGQFSCIPLNLLKSGTADYIVTGSWSLKAFKEAGKYGKAALVFPKADKFTGMLDPSVWTHSPDASYLYYCDNETIEGVEFDFIPDSRDLPLICDMSSNIFTRPVDVSRFGAIFAGAQKNAGCAGVTVLIIRDDLIGKPNSMCPLVFDYKQVCDNHSLLNTPSCYSIYIMGLVMDWIKRQGGVKEIQKVCDQKAKLIYDAIDASDDFYYCAVEKKYRSRINICFRIGGKKPSDELEKKFLEAAAKRNMIQLKGHRSVGGIRASLYNALTLEDAQALADLMVEFMKLHKK